MRLDQRTIQQFERDGVVVLPDALSPAELEAAQAAWQWSVDHPGPGASGLVPGTDQAFQDLGNPEGRDRYEALVRELPLASIAQQLWSGSAVWYFYEQVFHKRAENVPRTPWHQDTSYWPINGADLIAFWISFESIPAAASLEYVKGSFRGPLYNTSRFDPDDATLPIAEVAEDHPDYLPRLPDIEANRALHDIVSFATEPGDVVAFHTSTLHGGGATDASTPERRTLTLRFFGEDCFLVRSPGRFGIFADQIEGLAVGDAIQDGSFPKVEART